MKLLQLIRNKKDKSGFANILYETKQSFAYCQFINKGIEKYFNEFGNFTLTIWL